MIQVFRFAGDGMCSLKFFDCGERNYWSKRWNRSIGIWFAKKCHYS